MGFLYRFYPKSSIVIGRDQSCDISISHPAISRIHLKITVDVLGSLATLSVAGRNGISVEGCFVERNTQIYIGKGDLITFADVKLIWLGESVYISCLHSEISTRKDLSLISFPEQRGISKKFHSGDFDIKDEHNRFVPSIRNTPSFNRDPIEIESPPPRKIPERATFMLAIGPALTMAIPMLLGVGRKISILTSIFAAFWAASNFINRQAKIKKEEKRRRNSYISYIQEMEEKIRQRQEEIIISWQANYPPIEEYLKGGGNPFLIWNKKIDSPDRDCIRIGIGRRTSPVDIVIPKEKFAQVDDSLKELPVKLKEKYNMLNQVPITIDLKALNALGFVYDSISRLCHVLNAFIIQLCLNYKIEEVGLSLQVTSSEMEKEMSWLRYLPHINGAGAEINIVITDNSHIVNSLVSEEKVKVLILKRRLPELPSFVDEIVIIQKNFQGLLTAKHGQKQKNQVLFDNLHPIAADDYSRIISRLAGEQRKSEVAIPERVDFGELFDKITSQIILERWREANTAEDISIPIGMEAGNRIRYLNLHERFHGPHGIVGGTTGSGKSELLATMILAAALSFPPDQIGFFLIDYKGGGTSNMFKNLPQVLGSISNLSIHETNRAMISLRSENIRRQQIFLECGVNNISDYTRGYKEGKFSEALPHVLVIIDEFAELKKEQPDFMTELISLAAVGRSLGMHLILATQKPGGVVDGKIRSNSKFRIALRVEDKSDSEDMLKKPDAAFITNCGRAYMQVGNNEVYEQFQSGYTGGSACGNVRENIKIFDRSFKEIELEKASNEEYEGSWFDLSMKAILDANKVYTINPPRPLWLPPLAEKYLFDSNEPHLGTIDDPENQRYLLWDRTISEMGHICVLGNSQSGKSTFLQTMLLTLILRKELYEIYIVDMGGGSLKSFDDSNEVGGYIDSAHMDRIPKLLLFLKDELILRRQSNYENEMVIIIDNYSDVTNMYEDMAESILTDILKFGKSLGMYLIVTALGIGSKELPGRMLEGFDTRLLLGAIDTFTAAGIMKCQVKNLPVIEKNPGRGIVNCGNRILSLQTTICEDKNEIACVIKQANTGDGVKAREFPYIPNRVSIDALINKIPDVIKREISSGKQRNLPIGFIEETGRIYELPFSKVSCIQVIGQRGTGKKTLLEAISLVGGNLNIKCLRVESKDGLLGCLEDEKLAEHILFVNLEGVLEDLYNSNPSIEQEEILSKIFDNSVKKSKGLKLIVSVSEKVRSKFQNTNIYEALIKNPYVICMGGGLDEVRMYDYSYLPYSVQSQRLPAGHGVIRKYNQKIFYGNVIFPKMIWQEDE